MGVDLPDIRKVVHIQAPGSLEAWWQEAGRAGRDGAPADAVLLYSAGDAVTQARLREGSTWPGAEEGWRALTDLIFGADCREATVVRHFTDQPPTRCGRCDACVDPERVAAQVDRTRDQLSTRRRERVAKLRADAAVALTAEQEEVILSFVGAMKRPSGKRLVAQGLRGGAAKAVKRRGLTDNPQHGALKAVPEEALVAAIERLLDDGRLARKGKKYPTVWLPDRPVRPARGSARPAARPSGFAAVLRDWRRREAKRRRWKPYQVFDDRTLAEIVDRRPTTWEALAAIRGMGPKRLDKFAAALIELVEAARDQGDD
jgi:ATP-dependent DNA helicase RecQ